MNPSIEGVLVRPTAATVEATRNTDGGTELIEGADDTRDQPNLVQADAAEGRGGRADEQRAAAQRENGDAGEGLRRRHSRLPTRR